MSNGKAKCKSLKQIRKSIADANGIEYAVRECPYQGECTGTCPKCEAEVKYLEDELAKRASLGKKIILAGVGVAALGTVACSGPDSVIIDPMELGGEPTLMEQDVMGEFVDPCTDSEDCSEEYISSEEYIESTSEVIEGGITCDNPDGMVE